MALQISEVLLTISFQTAGDWDTMFKMIKNKEALNKEWLIKSNDLVKSQYINIVDNNYPECYKHTKKPPLLLYYYGDLKLLNTPLIAVVGSRHPTDYQKRMTEKILHDFFNKTNNKYGLISGLAKGIDQIAMEVAISHQAKLVGILGSGIEYCYPKENHHLYDYCKNHGLLLSEYPDMTKPLPEHFPMRNRLIAEACKAMFVPASNSRSGTSCSIRLALEAGKDILAMPCNLEENDYTNYLIHDGASVVLNSDDLIDALKIK